MLIKYLILLSFLNLVLSEAFAQVCLEENNTIKYENIFSKCCQEDPQILITKHNTFEPEIQKASDVCCVDYDHNYTYVPEQYVMQFNCKEFRPTEIAQTEFTARYSSYDNQKIISLNIYKIKLIETSVIRI